MPLYNSNQNYSKYNKPQNNGKVFAAININITRYPHTQLPVHLTVYIPPPTVPTPSPFPQPAPNSAPVPVPQLGTLFLYILYDNSPRLLCLIHN